MRHILSLAELTRDQIEEILGLGARLKRDLKAGKREAIFQNKVLGLLFEKPSLRTRVSFEALMNQHGGASLYLGADVGWPAREPPRDFMPILTSYLDLLVIRAKSHASVVEAAKFSQCPIINGLTDVSHPCQALADIMTVREHAPTIGKVKVAYVGDANNVAVSLAEICSKLSIEFTIAAPIGYQFDAPFFAEIGLPPSVQTADPAAALADADFIYADVWTSMGQEAESAKRLKAFANYQVDEKLFSYAKPNAKFLHCLPARRGEEVSSNIIDGPRSLVIPQAENRLHAQKGLVAWLFNHQ